MADSGEEIGDVNMFFSDQGHVSDEDQPDQPDSSTSNLKAKSVDVKKTVANLLSIESDRLSFVAKVVTKPTKKASDVWTRYKQVYLDGKPTDIWKCDDCTSLFVYNSASGNSHMNRHNCKNDTHGKKSGSENSNRKITQFVGKNVHQDSVKKLNRDITVGLAKDLQPLYRSETEGFRFIAQALVNFGAKYGAQPVDKLIQHRTTLKRTHLPNICAEVNEKIKEELKKVPSHPKYAFSKDLWSDKYKSKHFLSLHAHYIDHEWKLNKRMLGLEEFVQEKTTANIRIQCHTFRILSSTELSTTDGGYNMLKLFKKRLPCSCHKINLFVDWTFRDKKLPTVDEIAKREAAGKPFHPMKLFKLSNNCPQIQASLAGVKNCVTHFKQSNLNGKLPITLKQDVPTRWNSQLIMLDSYDRNINEVKSLLLQNDRLDKLMPINNALIKELITFLTPFKECSETLSGDKYPTIHLVAPWFVDLKEHIKKKPEDSVEIKALKEQSAYCFRKYLVIEDYHYVACILDPRYKKLHFADNATKKRALKLLQKFIDETPDPSTTVMTSADSVSTVDETPKRQSRFQKYMDPTDNNEQVMSELDRYIACTFPGLEKDDEKFDILAFRKERSEFPRLRAVAHWLLAIPASEASDERVFSDAGYVMTPRATNLKPGTLSQMIYVHENAKI